MLKAGTKCYLHLKFPEISWFAPSWKCEDVLPANQLGINFHWPCWERKVWVMCFSSGFHKKKSNSWSWGNVSGELSSSMRHRCDAPRDEWLLRHKVPLPGHHVSLSPDPGENSTGRHVAHWSDKWRRVFLPLGRFLFRCRNEIRDERHCAFGQDKKVEHRTQQHWHLFQWLFPVRPAQLVLSSTELKGKPGFRFMEYIRWEPIAVFIGLGKLL